MKMRRVAVIMGGISSEHPVSLRSGAGMLAELDASRFVGFPVLISQNNIWMWPKQTSSHTLTLTADAAAAYIKAPPSDWVVAAFPHFQNLPECDIALLALHGVGGEDGRLQGFFEMAGLPFTGSGSFGATLAMDKIVSKQIYQANGIPTAPFRVLAPLGNDFENPEAQAQRAHWVAMAVKELGLPLLVKQPKGGSSLGMGIAQTLDDAQRLVTSLGSGSDSLLLESFVKGREVTCGVLEGRVALAPTEIRPKQDGFFNYEAKYQVGRTEEITPAPMPAKVVERIQEIALYCHRSLRLSVYSRTDMIIAGDAIFVLETNNLPGFTPTSILPQQAKYAGMSYQELLTCILDLSWSRHQALVP